MIKEHLAIIGGGNMARSLIGGVQAKGLPATHILVAEPQAAQREALEKQFAVRTMADNVAAAQQAQVIVLAVKPQDLYAVALQLAPALQQQRPLIISIAAGIRTSDLQAWLGGLNLVRAMPNRPALNGCGMTGLFATTTVSAHERALTETLLSAVGRVVWVDDEAHMDIVTAISGSGPAYFFLMMEILETTAIELGLPADISRILAVETAYGAGYMAHINHESPSTLRMQVTSKGGTTEAALKVLEDQQVRKLFAAAITAAARRSAELGQQSAASVQR